MKRDVVWLLVLPAHEHTTQKLTCMAACAVPACVSRQHKHRCSVKFLSHTLCEILHAGFTTFISGPAPRPAPPSAAPHALSGTSSGEGGEPARHPELIPAKGEGRPLYIFGHSYGFGLADHKLSKQIVEEDGRFVGYSVDWSNAGY